jgi:hypothetical protein
MKRMLLISTVLIFLSLLLTAGQAALFSQEKSGSPSSDPSITYIHGTVSICKDKATWVPLAKDTPVKGSDWISTTTNSCIILTINGNDSVTVGGDSMCALYDPSEDDTPKEQRGEGRVWQKLYLNYGRMWVKMDTVPEKATAPLTLVTPTSKMIAKSATFEVVKGKRDSQPEEYWVMTGTATLNKKNKDLPMNALERVFVMPGQQLPAAAAKFNPKNISDWQKWNESKDKRLAAGDAESLEKTPPPKVSTLPASYPGGPGGGGSGPSAPSAGNPGSNPGVNTNSNFNYQEIRDRIRIPPAYKP